MVNKEEGGKVKNTLLDGKQSFPAEGIVPPQPPEFFCHDTLGCCQSQAECMESNMNSQSVGLLFPLSPAALQSGQQLVVLEINSDIDFPDSVCLTARIWKVRIFYM